MLSTVILFAEVTCIVALVIVVNSQRGQQSLRGFFERRWRQPARTVNALAVAGALSGLMSCGVWMLALVIFPLALAVGVRRIDKWGWLESRVTEGHSELNSVRRPLRLLYASAAAPLLMTWPLFPLWMLVAGFVAFPMGVVYGHLRTGLGSDARARAVDDFELYVGFAIAVLLYCGLVNRAFRRLTGMRSRALAWQFVGWLSLLMLCLTLLNTALGTGNRAESDMTLPLLLTAIVTAYLLKQAGSVFGQWLARSASAL